MPWGFANYLLNFSVLNFMSTWSFKYRIRLWNLLDFQNSYSVNVLKDFYSGTFPRYDEAPKPQYSCSMFCSIWTGWEDFSHFLWNPVFHSLFYGNDFFLYTVKLWENLWFSDYFRGYRKRKVAWKCWISRSNL